MGALAATRLTLLDHAKRQDPGGAAAAIAEILHESNEILDDMIMKEGNLTTGHKVTVRASLPTPTWRLLNKGVTQTKSVTNQLTEACGLLEARSEIDIEIYNLNGGGNEFRLSEDVAFIEGMNQTMAYTLFYGDTSVDPEKFVGLGPRYYAVSGATTSANVIDAGGTGTDNGSIWLVGWGNDTVFGIYPKGSKAGLEVDNKGKQTVYDADSKPFEAMVTRYVWKLGLCVKNWKFVTRICNVDWLALKTTGDTSDTSANLIKFMCQAIDALPTSSSARPAFYMPQKFISMLRVKLLSKSNVHLSLEELVGASGVSKKTLHFMGIPCRRVDQMLVTESRITT